MSLPSHCKTRWLANMQAAGVDADEETINRTEGGVAERLESLDELLTRLDFHNSNPDYLRPRKEMGAGDERE